MTATLDDVEPDEVVATLEAFIEQVYQSSLGLSPDSRALHRVAADALGSDKLAAILGTKSGGANADLQRRKRPRPGVAADVRRVREVTAEQSGNQQQRQATAARTMFHGSGSSERVDVLGERLQPSAAS